MGIRVSRMLTLIRLHRRELCMIRLIRKALAKRAEKMRPTPMVMSHTEDVQAMSKPCREEALPPSKDNGMIVDAVWFVDPDRKGLGDTPEPFRRNLFNPIRKSEHCRHTLTKHNGAEAYQVKKNWLTSLDNPCISLVPCPIHKVERGYHGNTTKDQRNCSGGGADMIGIKLEWRYVQWRCSSAIVVNVGLQSFPLAVSKEVGIDRLQSNRSSSIDIVAQYFIGHKVDQSKQSAVGNPCPSAMVQLHMPTHALKGCTSNFLIELLTG